MKAERDSLNGEARDWAEKRDNLHEEMQKLRLDARGFRDKRDELNAEIQLQKTVKEERREKRAEAIKQLKSQRQKITAAPASRAGRNSKSLEAEIAEIDWKIQTEPHSMDEEKRLVEQVRALEVQLQAHRKVDRARGKISGLGTEAQTLKEDIKTDSDKIRELAEQSQRFHGKMVGCLEKIKALKTEADENHKKYVEAREKAKGCHAKFVEKLEQIKTLRAAVRRKEEDEKAKQEADLKRKVEDEALSKLKQGKKLSFDEFKILAEQGKI